MTELSRLSCWIFTLQGAHYLTPPRSTHPNHTHSTMVLHPSHSHMAFISPNVLSVYDAYHGITFISDLSHKIYSVLVMGTTFYFTSYFATKQRSVSWGWGCDDMWWYDMMIWWWLDPIWWYDKYDGVMMVLWWWKWWLRWATSFVVQCLLGQPDD